VLEGALVDVVVRFVVGMEGLKWTEVEGLGELGAPEDGDSEVVGRQVVAVAIVVIVVVVVLEVEAFASCMEALEVDLKLKK